MHLYSDYSHLSHRVRFAMAEKEPEFKIHYLETKAQESAFAEANPPGILPTLRIRENVILYDAGVLINYLEERFPHPVMMPVYPEEKAEFRQVMGRIDRDLGSHCHTILHGTARQSEKARKEFQENLWSLLRVFDEQPWFMSDEFSMLDCCMAPLLWRLPQLGIPVRESNHTRPMLRYMKRVFAREKFMTTLSVAERDIRLK